MMDSLCMCNNDKCPCYNCASVDYDYGGYRCIGCITPPKPPHWYDLPLTLLVVLGVFSACLLPAVVLYIILRITIL